jgi:hypothetical protein
VASIRTPILLVVPASHVAKPIRMLRLPSMLLRMPRRPVHVRMLLRTHAYCCACKWGPPTHAGTASVCARFLRLLILEHELLLQHTPKTGETFTTYAYNMCIAIAIYATSR